MVNDDLPKIQQLQRILITAPAAVLGSHRGRECRDPAAGMPSVRARH
jgi:hypothetical protein